VAHSEAPVILSHSNALAQHQSARNVSNQLIDAVTRSGGVVGIAGFPAMVSGDARPSLDQYVMHIDSVVQRAGIDHVGLGIDYYWGQSGVASDEVALAS
jgi:membrane dipeptidase